MGVFLVLNSVWFWRVFYPLPYKELIKKEAYNHHVEPLLIAAIIRNESKFNSKATSKRGAIGLMQIMPETGSWIAQQRKIKDFNPDSLFHPETNISYGTWYLANLSKEFHDDPVLIIAAYNGGRGNVRDWLNQNRWTGEHTTLDQIPFTETRNYVKKVLRDYEIYRELYPDLVK
ncbi:MAG: lytic transglycosylase domain-containing protein [Clostridia bacterium]|nr:lytic transglycosylase domain-containing protein [Clostridia bacterium]